MTNNRKINFKFQMSITEEHLGLTRVFNELAQIEDENKQLSPTDLHALKRRYMLRLLHNYSANTLHDATNLDINKSLSKGLGDDVQFS